MTTPSDAKVAINMRHAKEIRDHVDKIAGEQNLNPSVLYRQIFNAGLKSLYGIEVKNNKMTIL